jgi:hypothetical protein
MHVVVAIETFRHFFIKSTELVDLRGYDVLEGPRQPRVKYYGGKTVLT